MSEAWDTDVRSVRRPHKVRYTEAEWATIVQRARACGRPPARYVRETSLGVVPQARPGRATADVIHELGRIGTALARLATATREADPARAATLDATLAELLAVVRRLGRSDAESRGDRRLEQR
jgi:hypothetical protein